MLFLCTLKNKKQQNMDIDPHFGFPGCKIKKQIKLIG